MHAKLAELSRLFSPNKVNTHVQFEDVELLCQTSDPFGLEGNVLPRHQPHQQGDSICFRARRGRSAVPQNFTFRGGTLAPPPRVTVVKSFTLDARVNRVT